MTCEPSAAQMPHSLGLRPTLMRFAVQMTIYKQVCISSLSRLYSHFTDLEITGMIDTLYFENDTHMEICRNEE